MTAWAYYNEFDPMAAAWLRELIADGQIAPGEVDERSIEDVEADELTGFTQCHFFAGIGGWSAACRLAGWPDDRPIWTGSPPCQPFSVAGKQEGKDDDRHLAPHFLELVAAGRPPFLAGEQVANAVKKDEWLDDLLDALEREGYATGAAVSPACGIGSPNIRQRLWFVGRLGDSSIGTQRTHNRKSGTISEFSRTTGRSDIPCRLGDAANEGLERHAGHGDGSGEPGRQQANRGGPVAETGGTGRMAHSSGERCRKTGRCSNRSEERELRDGETSRMADAPSARHDRKVEKPEGEARDETRLRLPCQKRGNSWPDPLDLYGREIDWLYCRDGKWRPVKSGLVPLVDGLPRGVVPGSYQGMEIRTEETAEGRVMRLKGYGNAIKPHVGAEVILCLAD